MTTAGQTSQTITVEGMKGEACVQKVAAALKPVPNVTTESVVVGTAHVMADADGCKACCAAIESAGFKARTPTAQGGCQPAAPTHIPGGGSPSSAGSTGGTRASDQQTAATPLRPVGVSL